MNDARPRAEAPIRPAQASPLANNLLHAVLWLCIFSSFFVFVQPAPYEYLIGLLAFTSLLAGVTVDVKVLPLLFLMTLRDASGIISLFAVLDRNDSLQFFAISAYLGITATIFACLFAQDTMRRISTLRASYVMAGVVGTILGLIGYFSLAPGFQIFVLNDRVVSGFKDPNVFGPFLIPPLLWLVVGFITDRIRFISLIASLMIATGLLLAYSRAAWIHFVISGAVMFWLLIVASPDRKSRRRIMLFAGAGLVGAVVLVVALLSIDLVRDMLMARASLQSYDTGSEGSRFNTQAKALEAIFDFPLGMGPWEFLRINHLAAHNSIMGTLLNLGWIAGFSYTASLLLTVIIGFRYSLVRAPWQPFLIATYASFIGVIPVGFVIDTDHWRHYYLIVGIIWGLSIATINLRREQRMAGTYGPPSYAAS